MRKVIRGYAKDKIVLKDRCSLSDQISFILASNRRAFTLAMRDRDRANKNEIENYSLVASYKRAARADCAAGAACGRRRRDGTTTFFTAAQDVRFWHIADISTRSTNVRFWEVKRTFTAAISGPSGVLL